MATTFIGLLTKGQTSLDRGTDTLELGIAWVSLPPAIIVPRRLRGASVPVRRGQFQAVPPAAAPPTSGFVDQAGVRPRWAPLPISHRRGRRFATPPPAPSRVPGPPVFIDQSGSRPRWAPLPRRGLFLSLPSTAPTIATVFSGRRNRRLGASPRRGSFFQVPQPQIGPGEALPAPALSRTPVRRGFIARRGQFFTLSLGAPGVAPSVIRRAGYCPKWAPAIRRGQYLLVPPPQVGPGEGLLVGAMRRVATRPALPSRRGSFQALATVPVPTPSLQHVAGARPRFSVVRRGQFQLIPLPQIGPGEAYPAPVLGHQSGWRPRWSPAIRRGTFLLFPLPQIGPGEGLLAPSVQRHWQRFGLVARRSAFFATPAPALGYAPVVPVVVKPARRYLGLPARRGVALRVLPSLGYAPVVPARIVGRRQGLSIRRGSFQTLAPVTPVTFPPITPARRPLAVIARHGVVRPRPWFEPPGPAPLTPSVIRQAGLRPRWFPLPRRGQFSSALLVGLAPPPPVAVPAVLTHRRVGLGAIRRGAFGPVALVVTPPTGQQTRSRIRLTSLRRGSFLPLPLPALGYSPVVPAAIKPDRHYAGLPVRRGSALQVLPSLGYGPLTPARVIPARRHVGFSARRGAFQALTQALNPVPQSLRRLRAISVAARRGTFQTSALPITTPVVQQARARVRLAITRRGSFQTLPAPSLGYGPLVAARTAPARRLLGLPVRHGVVRPRPWFEPPGPQALVPPFIHHSGSRPKWGPLPRRGQFSSALLVGLAPPPPPPPVGNVARNPRRIALVRRGQFFAIPQVAPAISAVFVRRVRAAVSIRRGTFPAVVPTPRLTPWVPAPIQARRTAAVTVRRGIFQPTPATSPIVLRPSARTRVALWVRRGQFQAIPALTQVVPPRVLRPTTPRIAAPRRGRIPTSLSAPAAPPRWYRCARPAPGTRRGQFSSPPRIKPAGPGPLCPSILRATRRYPGLPFRRGRFIQGIVPPQEVFPEPVAGPGTTAPLAVAISSATTALALATDGMTVASAIAGAGLTVPAAIAEPGTTTPPAVANPHQ